MRDAHTSESATAADHHQAFSKALAEQLAKEYPAAQILDPICAAPHTSGYSCTRRAEHDGPHAAHISAGQLLVGLW